MKYKLFVMTITIFSLSNLLFAWTWPLSNSGTPDTFISAFGPRDRYSTPGLQYDFHRGMDLQASLNTDVYTAQTGTVTYSGWYDDETGYLITISDGTHKTAYIHLNECIAVLNQQVTEGQQGSQYRIALSGDTGCPGYPHLHFEYRTASDNDKKHPLKVMPYNDNEVVQIEMVTDNDRDFSFKITVNDTELDLDWLLFDLRWYHSVTGWFTTQNYLIDFSFDVNIPTGSTNDTIIYSAMANDDWRMYVTPLDFNPDTDQEITFRFTPEVENIHATEIWVDAYNAAYELETQFAFTSFTSTQIDNQIVENQASKLLNNHPNPFNPSTTISYSLFDNIQNPQIEIYNTRGQKVKNFALAETAGENSIVWNGKDENEKKVGSGVYFYRLMNEGKTVQTRKMLLMK